MATGDRPPRKRPLPSAQEFAKKRVTLRKNGFVPSPFNFCSGPWERRPP
ncbi:hypothetical protein HMPREF7215_0807 [Pyramidobacter piscolens W5455]|uniref:Uncharacterized protein n=1 Tax=Pyramidobacter piscolens W5455 TaxID=352165 RepID=A0ABM9ZV53_9BACT|nr:hypothetical protein HMPREF7215_0807 [Pyramidobacter piscolens W5455]